jgi:hypothetical protein
MKKLPGPESTPIKTSLYLPPELRESVKLAAKANGRTMNAEILARVTEAEDRATFKVLIRQNDDLRKLMREMLEQIEMLKR